MNQTNIQLLIIDPQNDFCDVPKASLPVPGATSDLLRVANLVQQKGNLLSQIHVTLDSHNPYDIAHAGWWQDQNGHSPSPFTVITEADVLNGQWIAKDPSRQKVSLSYVQALASHSRYQLIVWPEHCLMGSWGHGVQPDLLEQLNHWGRNEFKTVNYVLKGMNPTTEHYSAIQAEVPDPNDPSTLPDPIWLANLASADRILIAGEALSHCVASTVRDLADQLGASQVSKLVLLTDCCSPVSGFDAIGLEFIAEMTARGMQTATSLNCL